MGLLAFAIRLTLWRALYGATYAGPNVFDSAVGAIEMVGDADIERRPVLTVSTDEEKQSQLTRLASFHQRHAAEAQVQVGRLKQAVIDNHNVFEVLMDAVRVCSLGQITRALFEVGGQYRRTM